MTEERELKIPFEEASKISIECKCSAELTVDVRKNKDRDWSKLELSCMICGADFKTEILHLLKRLSEAQQKYDDSKTKVFFRIQRSGL